VSFTIVKTDGLRPIITIGCRSIENPGVIGRKVLFILRIVAGVTDSFIKTSGTVRRTKCASVSFSGVIGPSSACGSLALVCFIIKCGVVLLTHVNAKLIFLQLVLRICTFYA
jgi:hypothetical protein